MKTIVDSVITRQWRHKIYKKALELYMTSYSESGLCVTLEKACAMYGYVWTGPLWRHQLAGMIEALPEFQKYRPIETDPFQEVELNYWWPDGDRETRIKVLKEMIELTR